MLECDLPIWGGQPTVVGNTIEQPGTVGINVDGDEDYKSVAPHIESNTITGSGGIVWRSPAGSIIGNSISNGTAGLMVMSGNRSCYNGENFVLLESATPSDDGTNEFCEDTPTA